MDNTTKRRHFRAATRYLQAARKSVGSNNHKAWEQATNGLKQIRKLDAYSNDLVLRVKRKLTIIQAATQNQMAVD